MKAIKVNLENKDAIAAALREVNGSAYQHCYTDGEEIISLAERAENELEELLARKADLPGAVLHACSGGGKLPASYRNKRITTSIRLERRSTDWYLVEINRRELFPDQAGYERLSLTEAQDARAVQVLRTRYGIQRAQVAA